MKDKSYKSFLTKTQKGQLVDPISAILTIIQIIVNAVGWVWSNSPNWLKGIIFLSAVASMFLMLNLFFEAEIPPSQLRGITDALGIGLIKGKWPHRVLVPADCTTSLNIAQKVDIRNGTACSIMKDCIQSETNQSCKCSCIPSSNNSGLTSIAVWVLNLGGFGPAQCVSNTTTGAICNLVCPDYCDSKPDLIHNTSVEMTPNLPPDMTVSAYAFCAEVFHFTEADPAYLQALQNYTALDCAHRGFDYLNYRLVIEVELILVILYISFIILFPIIIKQT